MGGVGQPGQVRKTPGQQRRLVVPALAESLGVDLCAPGPTYDAAELAAVYERTTVTVVPSAADVPDGLKVDSAGNVWTSGPGGIRIISPDGKVLGQLKSPDKAQANIAFGGADLKTAYIMAAGNVYKLKVLIPGNKPLYAN